MSTAPMLTIQAEKPSEFEFDVSIRGLNESIEPQVRFVIEDVNGHNVSINCMRTPGKRWLVKVPALAIAESQRNFRIEVITEGYYFAPTSGTVRVDHCPSVSGAEGFRAVSAAPSRPMVEATVQAPPVTPLRPARDYVQLREDEQRRFVTQCGTSATVLSKVGDMLRMVSESEETRRKLSAKNLSKLLRTVESAVAGMRGIVGDR